MLSAIASILFALQPTPTFVKVHVNNSTQIQKIDGRDPIFGVKETVEELLIEKGYTPQDSGDGFNVQVSIELSKDSYLAALELNGRSLKFLSNFNIRKSDSGYPLPAASSSKISLRF